MKFEPYDEAKIYNTNSKTLDGTHVLIMGISGTHQTDIFYIVMPKYEEEFETGWPCMTLTEHCLRKFDE